MGISVTIFLGSKDPNLIYSLNQCQTDCCLIDPDDVDKFIGALPAFTMDQEKEILAYTLNIFRQFTFPTYQFHLESASYQRLKKLEKCQETLEKIIDEQLNYLVSRRYYRELFLHNSLVNLIPASGGYHLSDIKLAKNAPVIVITDTNPESFSEFGRIKDAVTIAPFLIVDDLKKNGVIPTIAVTNDPVISDHACKTELLIIDIVANPKLGLTKSQLIWTSSDSDLSLSHLIDGSLEEKIDAYVSEEEFALYVALELGAKEIFLAGDIDDDTRQRFEEKGDGKLLEMVDFPVQQRRKSNPLLLIDEHERSLTPKRILNEVRSSIDKEKPQSDSYRALIWAAEYEATIKLTNGWVNYTTINQVQKDLQEKKKHFLNLVKKVKETFKAKTDFFDDKYKSLIRTLPHRCIKPDFDFELEALFQSNPNLAKAVGSVKKSDFPKDLKIEVSAKNKLDLYVKKSAGIFQYFGHGIEYIEDEYDNASVVNIIIIPGLMNAEMQLLCLEMFPGLPVVTMEPRAEHFAQVMKDVQLISMMGRAGIWLYGSVKELSDAFRNLLENKDVKPLVLDPDPQNLRDDLAVLKRLIRIIKSKGAS